MALPIHFAPLQGYTDDAFRRIHHQLAGGIHTYYTPFVRMEGGGVRSKDMRDIRPEFNEGVPVVPQIIVKSMKEFEYLVKVVEEKGYRIYIREQGKTDHWSRYIRRLPGIGSNTCIHLPQF